MLIDLPRFIANERPTWTEFEQMLGRVERRTNRLPLEDAKRFHFLYQKVSSDLARISTFASEPALRGYLESLVARGYGEIHGTRERGFHWNPLRWFLVDFPRSFQRQMGGFIAACLITLVGCMLGGFAVGLDPEAKSMLLPGQFGHLLGNPSERVAQEELEAKDPDVRESGHATFASSLMANNIRVSINAMAFGMAWGIGTVLVLFYNGIILGLVVVDYILAGEGVFLAGWLLPHGAVEIPAILLGGQGGFVLAAAVLGRGDRDRLMVRLRKAAPDVANIVGGLAVLLVWAGLVESFLSQKHEPAIPYALKIAFGSVELILLGVLLFWPRRAAQTNVK